MKRILTIALALLMVLSVASCGGNDTATTTTTEQTPVQTTTGEQTPVTPAVNEGEFKAGVYTATSSYASGEMNMTWNFVLTLKADGTFNVTDGTTEKGAGTYALVSDHYELSYSDERKGSFVVQKDGTLKMTSDFPYGIATIQLALVGDIVFTYEGEVPAEGGNEGGNEEGGESDTAYTLTAGAYAVDYVKESAMGAVVYSYKATVGADGTFSYNVSFDMGGTTYAGSAASGTYTLVGNVFTFTDTEGNVTVGKVTANDVLNISLSASSMAKVPYEVNLVPAAYTVAEGEYVATYEKVSPMAGTVVYNYKATVGADGAFSYSVSFDMGGTPYDGASASGTYTLVGNAFTFTDADGNVTEGKLTADNTIVISLKASDMAKEPYEVTFTVAE
ncbi:MAG: hypothetical protein IJV98_03250 [Clostridia bacterium]|nr:hypothetical protein [Clostridia bacterium]